VTFESCAGSQALASSKGLEEGFIHLHHCKHDGQAIREELDRAGVDTGEQRRTMGLRRGDVVQVRAKPQGVQFGRPRPRIDPERPLLLPFARLLCQMPSNPRQRARETTARERRDYEQNSEKKYT